MEPAHSDSNQGIALFRSGICAELVEQVARKADALYCLLERVRQNGLSAASVLPPREKYFPTASSVTVLAAIDLPLLRHLFNNLHPEVHCWTNNILHDSPACDFDQAWLRRQYAPSRYPMFHAPHGWHQDGALGFNFGAASPSTTEPAILPMVTCWIALNPCGVDAPGLEFVRRRIDQLLEPTELTDSSVRTRFAPSEFWRPRLEPGDVLLFHGDVLHRTHVHSSMLNDRTSVELRFFSAAHPPARLDGDRFVCLGHLPEKSAA